MSQIMTTTSSPVPPALPQELMAIINAEAEKTSASIGAGSLNFLRFKRNLELTIDGVTEEIEYGKFAAILITSSEYNHAIWYKGQYRAGSTDSPDLVWLMKEANQFPAALPEQYHKKIGVGKDAHWGFQIRRRTVWVRLSRAGIDFEHPFIVDIPSSLLYGKSDKQGAFTWKDIIAFCKTESMRGVTIYPGMFVNKFIAHTSPQQGLFYFQPLCDQNGYIKYLDVDTIRSVLTLAQDNDIKSMAVVTEKLDYEGSQIQQAKPQTAQPAAQPAAQPQAQPQAAPAQAQAAQAAPSQTVVQPQQQPAQPQAQTQPVTQVTAQTQGQPHAQPAQPAAQAQPQAQPTGTAGLINNAQAVLHDIVNQNIAANQGATGAAAMPNQAPVAESIQGYIGDLG